MSATVSSGYEWGGDPLAEARAKARENNACPVNFVDRFTSEHWDCWEICSWFDCKECVATPEDFGFRDGDGQSDGGCV